MSKRSLWLLGALAALSLATAAKGDPVITDGNPARSGVINGVPIGGFQSDSTQRVARMSTTGGVSIYDEDRDRDKVRTWDGFLSNTSLAIGAADSNATPEDVHQYRYLKMLLKATPLGQGGNDTTSIVHLIVQFRECKNGNNDSSSVFAEYSYGQSTLGVSATGVDTTNSGHLWRGNAGTPWSGEYDITINANRNAVQSSISVNGRLFYYPNGVAIMLDNLFGQAERFNRLQIRIRNGGSNTTAGSSACAYNLSLIGFAQ